MALPAAPRHWCGDGSPVKASMVAGGSPGTPALLVTAITLMCGGLLSARHWAKLFTGCTSHEPHSNLRRWRRPER